MSQIQIPQSELIDVGKLTEDNCNPNRMSKEQLERLKTSIEKWGFIVPIITNKDLLIADGAQRLSIAKSLGMTQVSVIRLPVEEVDRRLLRQVLNKLRGEHELLLDAEEFDKIIELGRKDDLKYLLDLTDETLSCYLQNSDQKNPDWIGMPEFNQEDISGRAVVVHFQNESDIREFSLLVKQNITDKTRSIWFPKRANESNADKGYLSES
jgi:hypothetical protein